MDVDCAPVGLKRSSSAPMINEISASMSVSSPSASAPREAAPSTFNLFSADSPRVRRFSTSSSTGAPRLTPRVSQLRQEECVDVAGREAAHEKEIHSAMQISQSWEDLTIEAESLPSFSPVSKDTTVVGDFKQSGSVNSSSSTSSSSSSSNNANEFKMDVHLRDTVNSIGCAAGSNNKRLLVDPLSINLAAATAAAAAAAAAAAYSTSSPSPTRNTLGQRQCYSPGVWKNNLSPSPTRKAFATRRSLSPIAIRPSCLGSVKRKFELDDSSADYRLQPPAKRSSSGLLASVVSRLEGATTSICSPQGGGGGGGTVNSSGGTPESLSSVDSPTGFSFRPVDSPSPGRPASDSSNNLQENSLEPFDEKNPLENHR